MAQLIALSKGYEAIVDDADFEWLNSFTWCARVDRRRVYAHRNVYPGGRNTIQEGNPKRLGWKRQTSQSMHRLILPDAELVDHRDGNGLNNQRANLRSATKSGNAQNRQRQQSNTSGFIGVSLHSSGRCWVARIGLHNQVIRLGSFSDPIEAARARDAAALELHGEFASLNFPQIPTQQGEPGR